MKRSILAVTTANAALYAMGFRMSPAERAAGRFLRAPDGHDGPTVAELAEGIKKDFAKKQEQVQEIADRALKEAEKTGQLATETKTAADKALVEMNTVKEQLAEIEQKMARRPGADENEVKSYGAQTIESDQFKSYVEKGFNGSIRIELKATTVAQSGAFSARDNEIIGLPKRRLTVRDLLNVVPTTSSSVDYARQTVRTNNAAVVAEGAQKPTSIYEWGTANAPIRTIAHLAKLTRQALEDATQLQGEVDAEMRYGLGLAEENQLLNGDGTGQNLTGLIPNATAFASPIAITSPTRIDNIRLALLQAELALFPTDGVIMNPSDWAGIELQKDGEGRYVWANPQQLAGPTLWGKPVVSTPAMSIDKFLAGGFKLQTLYDRMQPEVVIASENADDFEKNLYTMRCEERIALAIKRAAALIFGDFGFVA